MSSLEDLQALDNAIQKAAGGQLATIRKQAEDLYQERVEQIAAQKGCSMSVAHAHAGNDAIAKKAYAISIVATERQSNAMSGAAMAGAYLGL